MLKYSAPDFSVFQCGTYGEYFNSSTKEFNVFCGEVNSIKYQSLWKDCDLRDDITRNFYHWDNTKNIWVKDQSYGLFRSNFASLELSENNIILIGGVGSSIGIGSTPSQGVYHTEKQNFKYNGYIDYGICNSSICKISDKSVFISGGVSLNGPVTDCYIYDIDKKCYSSKHYLITARSHHTSHYLPDKKEIIVIGGHNGVKSLSIQIFCLNGNKRYIDLSYERYAHSSIVLPNDKILITGGIEYGYSGRYTTTEIINTNYSVEQVANSHRGRAYHKSYLFGKYVLVHGGVSSNGDSVDPEFYDWEKDIWYLNQPDDFDLNDYSPPYNKETTSAKIEYGINCGKCNQYYPDAERKFDFKCWSCRNGW